jgi:2',3'-cyclic-nucleotide 2'-phosphodiesterase
MKVSKRLKDGVVSMRILFIGDIVGKPGRSCLKSYLPRLKNKQSFDFIIANGENAAGGAGITENVFNELRKLGVDLVTGGNHIWDQKDIFNFIDAEPRMIRPANYPVETTPGRGSVIIEAKKGTKKLAIINLIGRVFMKPADCPFRSADRELALLKDKTNFIIVDFHAEATSEKQALGWYLDGRVSAVLGTHSHVQTADERILPKKTAYITDVGMTGLYDSILGVDKNGPLKRFMTQLPHRLSISDGRKVFSAVSVEIDEENSAAVSIKRIYEII